MGQKYESDLKPKGGLRSSFLKIIIDFLNKSWENVGLNLNNNSLSQLKAMKDKFQLKET